MLKYTFFDTFKVCAESQSIYLRFPLEPSWVFLLIVWQTPIIIGLNQIPDAPLGGLTATLTWLCQPSHGIAFHSGGSFNNHPFIHMNARDNYITRGLLGMIPHGLPHLPKVCRPLCVNTHISYHLHFTILEHPSKNLAKESLLKSFWNLDLSDQANCCHLTPRVKP